MLVSAIIKLTVTRDAINPGPGGRQAQAWLLDQIEAHDQALVGRLHGPAGLRPYTVSSLMQPDWQMVWERAALTAGQAVCLRVTSMEAELGERLLGRILPNLPDQVNLGGLCLDVQGWTVSGVEHPWAGQSDYGKLVKAAAGQDARRARLEFASPTAFHSQTKSDVPLPIPGSVLRSWWEKWDAFAPEPLRIDPAWPRFADVCVLVNQIKRLSTRRWAFAGGERGGATGYWGEVEFGLLPERKAEEWRLLWPGSVQVLHTLAAFALYCGTGHHTTIGMGQTRKLAEVEG